MEEQHCATPTSYPSSTYHDRSFLYPHQREYSRRTLHEPPYPSQWSRRLDSESRQHHGEADSWHSRYAQPISRPDPTDSNTYRSRSPPNPSLPIRQPSEHPLARHSDAFEYPPNHIFYSRPAPPVPAYHDAPPPYEHPYPPHHHYPQHPQRYPRYPYPAPDHRYRSPEYPAPYPPSLPPAPPQCNCGDVACLEFSRSSRYTHDSRYVYRPHPPPRQPPPMPAYSAKEPVAHPESTSLNLDTKSSQKSGTSTIIALPKVSPTGGINVLAVEVSETVRGSMKTSIPPELVAKSDLPPANITEQKRYVVSITELISFT
ncbi:hypothetical protein BJ742DRAFT_251352 [Cladochytrium replicatum]|nr:hypothetical protein BJ742DRAFT_251352 [Cladochytrium replicatum]